MNKIINALNYKISCCIILSTVIIQNAFCQDSTVKVVNSFKEYHYQVIDDSLKQMVELKTLIPSLVYDLRYATKNNFTHEKLYKKGNKTFLRKPVADALAQVQGELNKNGMGLKIFDAYRPYAVTKKMWELIQDDRYVADPKKGSGHNRGTAVDLTIINLQTGEELDMGTSFDNFTDTAHQTFTALPAAILQNRQLLKTTMEKYGFIALRTEWWHYYWNKASDYELLNIDFKKFR